MAPTTWGCDNIVLLFVTLNSSLEFLIRKSKKRQTKEPKQVRFKSRKRIINDLKSEIRVLKIVCRSSIHSSFT